MKTKTTSIFIMVFSILYWGCSGDTYAPEDISRQKNMTETNSLKLPSGATVKRIGNTYLWQDDILLSNSQLQLFSETGAPFDTLIKPQPNSLIIPASSGCYIPNNDTKSCSVFPNANIWSMVRFVYAPEGYANETQLAPYTKYIIQLALRHWESKTNVRFYNATGLPTHDDQYNFDYPYIYFCNGGSNNSYIGRIGGKQVLHLAPFQTMGIAAHEIGHAIGLYHEQSRSDRDNYVSIRLNNVVDSARNNYDKITKDYLNIGNFDFGSIMLYSSYDFAIDPTIPTMTKRDGTTFIGQRDGLSEGDRRFPNRYYYPFIARSDTYAELDTVMYDRNNIKLTRSQILEIQSQLNNGNPNPPANGRIENNF